MMRAIMSKAAADDTTAVSHSKTLAEMFAYVARVIGSEDRAKRELHAVLKREGERIYAMSEMTRVAARKWRGSEWQWYVISEKYNEVIDQELWIRSDIGPDEWKPGVHWENSVLATSIQRGKEIYFYREFGVYFPESAVEAIFERWPDPDQCPEAAKDPPDTAMLVRKKTNRTASPEDEAVLVSRINSVLASARRRFPDRSKWPSFRGMAQALVREGHGHGFDETTVRQILTGQYPPAMRRQIPGLSRG